MINLHFFETYTYTHTDDGCILADYILHTSPAVFLYILTRVLCNTLYIHTTHANDLIIYYLQGIHFDWLYPTPQYIPTKQIAKTKYRFRINTLVTNFHWDDEDSFYKRNQAHFVWIIFKKLNCLMSYIRHEFGEYSSVLHP